MKSNSLVIVGKVITYNYRDGYLTAKIKNGVDYYRVHFRNYIDEDKIGDIIKLITTEMIIFRGYLSDHNDGERFTIYITSYKKYKKLEE